MTTSTITPFSDLLRNSRVALGLKLTQVCMQVKRKQRRFNIAENTLSYWEKGRYLPSAYKIEELYPLAEILRINFKDFKQAYWEQSRARPRKKSK